MLTRQHGRVSVEHRLAILIVSLIAADEFEISTFAETASGFLGRGGFSHGGLCCVRIRWHVDLIGVEVVEFLQDCSLLEA